jgi:hypothetical protein
MTLVGLWHFTCEHGAEGLRESRVLLPWSQLTKHRPPVPIPPVAWMTSLDTPQGAALSREYITCDRTRYRFWVLDATHVQPWWRWRRAHPEFASWARDLEQAPGALPAHWFVSERPVPVVEVPREGVVDDATV